MVGIKKNSALAALKYKCAKDWEMVRVFDCVDKAKEFIYRNWKDMDEMFYLEKKLYGKEVSGEHAGVV